MNSTTSTITTINDDTDEEIQIRVTHPSDMDTERVAYIIDGVSPSCFRFTVSLADGTAWVVTQIGIGGGLWHLQAR